MAFKKSGGNWKKKNFEFIPQTPPSYTPPQVRVKPAGLTCQPQGLTWICVDPDLPKKWDLRVQNPQFFPWVDSQVPAGMPKIVACPTLQWLDCAR